MYCSLVDLKGRISEEKILALADFDDTGEIDNVEVQERISNSFADAAAEIDSYCQARYQIPFNPVPDVIKKLAIDISLYNLFSLRGFDEGSPDKVISDRYKAAIKTLENISKGIVTVGVSDPPVVDTANRPDFTGPDRVFSREKMSGF